MIIFDIFLDISDKFISEHLAIYSSIGGVCKKLRCSRGDGKEEQNTHKGEHNTTQYDTRDTMIKIVELSREQAEPMSAENECAEKYNTRRCSETMIEERKKKKIFP
jgi:hypothetical protein